jgi:hypothetical protein
MSVESSDPTLAIRFDVPLEQPARQDRGSCVQPHGSGRPPIFRHMSRSWPITSAVVSDACGSAHRAMSRANPGFFAS